MVGDLRQITQGPHLRVQRREVPLENDRIDRAGTLGPVRASGVAFRRGRSQQVGDLVRSEPLGLQSADRCDALDVRWLVEAEVLRVAGLADTVLDQP